MEPASVGRSFQINVFNSVNKKIDNIKNAIKEFSFTPKEKTRLQIVQTEIHKTAPFDLGKEVGIFHENINQGMLNGSNDEVNASLQTFARNIYRSNKGKEDVKDQMIAIEIYVNTVLDVMDNNPQMANLIMEHLLSRFLVDDNAILALLSNPRFNIYELNEQQANTVLQAGVGLVSSFINVPHDMHENICKLVKLTKTTGKDLEDIIEKSITALNVDLAESLIEINDGKLPNIEKVMARAIEEQDLNIVGLIVKFSDRNGKNELIKKCVNANLEKFLEDILPIMDQKLTESQISDFSKQAHSQGNLSLMKNINPKWKEFALSEFKNIPEELKPNKLTEYFLNSNKNEVNELTLLLKSNGLISDTLLNEANKFNSAAGKLISRFPNPMHQQEVFQAYGKNYENYEQQQQGYGEKHLQLVNKVIEELKLDPSKTLESAYLTMINSTEKTLGEWA